MTLKLLREDLKAEFELMNISNLITIKQLEGNLFKVLSENKEVTTNALISIYDYAVNIIDNGIFIIVKF